MHDAVTVAEEMTPVYL